MTNNSPELQFLLDEVARSFGGRISTATDFDALSQSIEASTGSLISVSTLKRLWGYITPQSQVRMSTLNLLARYTGRDSYTSICKELGNTSGFISAECIHTDDLQPGVELMLHWQPDRHVRIKYQGNNIFLVIDPGTSKLRSGDEFSSSSFLKGHPLYLDSIVRNGEKLPPHVAGRSGGLTGIESV